MPRRLWAVCFLLAPFAEAVTGFGVGYIIALAALRRLGLGGLQALLLGLYSQSLVPWGALATGTTVGATLAGLTPNQLGLELGAAADADPCALPRLLLALLPREAGFAVSPAQKIDDALWTALLLGLVWLANRYSDVEIAGAAPTALLLALRFWRDERPDRARLVAALQRQRALCRADAGALRHAAGAAAARFPEALVGDAAVTTTSRPSRRSTRRASGWSRSA